MIPDIANEPEVKEIIRRALQEDIGAGDVTSLALVEPTTQARATMYPRQSCVLAGLTVAEAVFKTVAEDLEVERHANDGQRIGENQHVLYVRGCARAILAAERVALNFIQRLSGIATLTAEFVQRARGVAILDTRKTTPTLRILEKYAVLQGGGVNHRFGLFDRILIKDNHRTLWRKQGGGSLAEAVRTARRRYPSLSVEIEIESLEELTDALEGSPDWVLLDNMPMDLIKRCVDMCRGRCRVEVSGGVTLATVRTIAETGVDAISVGALTHSAAAVDFTLEWMASA